MSTQVGIGKSIHRNPKIAASEAAELALRTGATEKADFVFMFSSAGYDQKTIVKYVALASSTSKTQQSESFFTELVRPENRCSSGLDP
jgi:hypothetical protein